LGDSKRGNENKETCNSFYHSRKLTRVKMVIKKIKKSFIEPIKNKQPEI